MAARAIATIIALGGPTGSGKSSVAVRLAKRIRRYHAGESNVCSEVRLLRSDVIKKQLVGVDPLVRLPMIYEHSQNAEYYRLTYNVLHTVAKVIQAAGEIVLLDASYCWKWQRADLAKISSPTRFMGFWLDASIETRIRRIRGRKNDASDAEPDFALQQKISRPLYEIGWHCLDTDSLSVDEVVLTLDARLCDRDH